MSDDRDEAAPAQASGLSTPVDTSVAAGPPGPAGPSSAAESTRTTTTLATVPALGGLYARALRPRRSPDLTHATLPDVTYRVADVVADEAQLVAYQRLLGEPVDGTLPAGFVHVLAFPVATALMVRDDFPLRLAGMVHLSNAVTVHRTISSDERLLVHAHAENLRPHRKGTQVDLVTEVSARYGAGDSTEVVWRGVSTYLAKGTMLGEDSADGDPSAVGGNADSASGRPSFAPPTPTAQWHLDAATGRRYAAVSGDRNPIHLSALTAKAFGFPPRDRPRHVHVQPRPRPGRPVPRRGLRLDRRVCVPGPAARDCRRRGVTTTTPVDVISLGSNPAPPGVELSGIRRRRLGRPPDEAPPHRDRRPARLSTRERTLLGRRARKDVSCSVGRAHKNASRSVGRAPEIEAPGARRPVHAASLPRAAGSRDSEDLQGVSSGGQHSRHDPPDNCDEDRQTCDPTDEGCRRQSSRQPVDDHEPCDHTEQRSSHTCDRQLREDCDDQCATCGPQSTPSPELASS